MIPLLLAAIIGSCPCCCTDGNPYQCGGEWYDACRVGGGSCTECFDDCVDFCFDKYQACSGGWSLEDWWDCRDGCSDQFINDNNCTSALRYAELLADEYSLARLEALVALLIY